MKRISSLIARKSFRRMDTTVTIFILIHVSVSSADRIFISGVDSHVGVMDVGYSFMAHLLAAVISVDTFSFCQWFCLIDSTVTNIIWNTHRRFTTRKAMFEI
jgi:hypothetical protein